MRDGGPQVVAIATTDIGRRIASTVGEGQAEIVESGASVKVYNVGSAYIDKNKRVLIAPALGEWVVVAADH